MRATRTLLVGTMLVGCAGEPMPAPQMATTAQWDDAAAREVRAEFERMATLWEAMDLEGLKALLATDGFVTSYDLDLDNKPLRMASRDDAVRYAEEMFAQLKKMGGSLKVEIHSIECRATSTVGYCSMDDDFVATMPDGTKVTQPSRVTGTFRKGDDGWKWTQWHTSLAQLPASPAPPVQSPAPTSPASALAPVEHDVKALKLADVPDVKGVKGALLWQNPATGASATVTQFPKGAQFPAHFHTHGLHIYVIKGTFSWTDKNGMVHDVKAGGYTYEPAKDVHTTASKNGCTFLQINEGTFDLVPVDNQGTAQTPLVPIWPAPQK